MKRNFIEGEEALRMIENMQPRRNHEYGRCISQELVCSMNSQKLLPAKWGWNSIQFIVKDLGHDLNGLTVFGNKDVVNGIFSSYNHEGGKDFYIVNRTYRRDDGTEYEMLWVADLSIF